MMKKKTLWEEIKRNWLFYVLPIPALIYLLIFAYIPMAGIYVVFCDYNFEGGLFGSPFVGLNNFKFFFSNLGLALRSTRNTVVVNIGSIAIGTVVNIFTAIVLNEILNKKFSKTVQTLILFPYFLSWIVVGMIVQGILQNDGIVNDIIRLFGGEGVDWYATASAWWPIAILCNIWKGFGYNSIIYYSTLMGFDSEMYEAADSDGATRWQKIRYITLPLLRPTVLIMTLLAVGGILQGSLDQVIGLTNLSPLLMETMDTIPSFVYRTAMSEGNFEMASAVGLFQSLCGFVLVLGANLLAKKVDPDYALF